MTPELTKYFCITHKMPDWEIPEFMTLVGSGDYVPPKGISFIEEYPELVLKNIYYSEYAVLFALAKKLRQTGTTAKYIGICHYRRFLLKRLQNHFEFGQGGYHAIKASEFQQVKIEDFCLEFDHPVIPTIIDMGTSVQSHYATYHVLSDLLQFFIIAIECGVITQMDAANFLAGREFIVTSSVSQLPTEWFLEIFEALEKVVNIFTSRYFVDREGYQKRAIGFCCERLQALLILKRLRETQLPVVMSSLVIVTAEDGVLRNTE